MLGITKVLVGTPIKGNTVSRQMKAANRAAMIHATTATALTYSAGLNSAYGNSALVLGSLLGVLASFTNVATSLSHRLHLQPEHKEILQRYKQIYKK